MTAFAGPSRLAPRQPPPGFPECVHSLCLRAPHLASPLHAVSVLADWPRFRAHPLFAKWQDQSAWSDESYPLHANLWDSHATERMKSLRQLNTAPDAGLWLTALPRVTANERFSPPEWQALLRFRSGVQLSFGSSPTCLGCGAPMDSFGDHSLSCASTGMYRRHNRVRDTLFTLSKQAGWRPLLEPPTSQSLRPADVLLQSSDAKPVAVDVTIVHPLRLSGPSATRDVATATANCAEQSKLAANSAPCSQMGWLRTPFALETTGGLGSHASRLCNRLTRSLSMKSGLPTQDPECHVHLAISIALAKGRGEMLVASRFSSH